jgi:hypothetical protein
VNPVVLAFRWFVKITMQFGSVGDATTLHCVEAPLLDSDEKFTTLPLPMQPL